MLFIFPMWDHESQRLGKRQCTPRGYKLHGIAELLGFFGFIVLLVIGGYLMYRRTVGTFHVSLLWLLAVPFGLGIMAEALFWYSWTLAKRKGFQYDYKTNEASWMEDGQRRTYKWTPSKLQERPMGSDERAN